MYLDKNLLSQVYVMSHQVSFDIANDFID